MTFVPPKGRIAVTGATGFVGQELVKQLAEAGYRVVGLSERVAPPPRLSKCLSDYYCVDLTQAWPEIGPFDGVVHLAGLAAVGPSFERPQDYLNINSAMVTCFFEHALQHEWAGRAIIVSSGAVYGSAIGGTQKFAEDSKVQATSPYVVSKLLVENQTEYYVRRNIDAVVTRPFNHIGPGQGPGFIVPDLVAKMRSLRPGSSIVTEGNLDSARDYTDVRDIAYAYRLLLELPEPRHAVYNVCSGSARPGWDVLETVCNSLGRRVPEAIVTAERAVDPATITGDASRLRAETGWTPTIPFQTSVDDFVGSI